MFKIFKFYPKTSIKPFWNKGSLVSFSNEKTEKNENEILYEKIKQKYFSNSEEIPRDQDVAPIKPKVPSNCCGGGCEDCVFDEYLKNLKKYEEDFVEWKKKHNI